MSIADSDMPVAQEAGSTTQGATGIYNVDAMLSGAKWNALSLTFMFPDTVAYFGAGYGNQSALQGFALATAAQQTAAKAAFAALSGFTDLLFTETSASLITGAWTPQVDITIARSSNPATAFAYYPHSSQVGGDVWLGINGGNSNPVKGNYGWHTMWHELGHSMGLKHGHETDGVASHALTADRDSMEFSIMTYRGYIGAEPTGYVNETWGYAQSFMMYDIAALQAMYGADFTTNAGNSVYTFSSSTGEMFINGVGQGAPGGNRIFLTLWDGGGVDTYDFSNYTTNLSIDLTPGGWSTLSQTQIAYLGGGNYARANVFNALQYNGDVRSLIENAIGGSGNDTITGNAANNVLTGNGGNDSLSGGGGDDDLLGGAGADTMAGGTGNDRYFVTDAGDVVVENAGEGTDTLFASASYALSATAEVEWLYVNTATGISLSGSNFDNRIVGGIGNDTLDGGAGNDVIDGGAGNDSLVGGSGDDQLWGSAGADTMAGGIGNDWYFVADAGDVIVENAGQGTDFLFASASYNLSATAEVEWLYVNTASGISLGGSDFDNRMVGGIGNDTIDGGGGNDVIDGGAGNDSLIGGSGDDQLWGSGGSDTMTGGLGNDWYFVADAGDLVIEAAGQGTDTLLASASYNLSATAEVEWLYVNTTAGISLGGSDFANRMVGGIGNDTIDGGAGNDVIDGGAGNDSLIGGSGDDQLWGSGGADTMAGGLGNDSYFVTDAGDVIVEAAGAGTDTLFASTSYNLSATAEVEWLYVNTAAGISLGGSDFANRMVGGGGNDTISGGGGNDVIDGGAGGDFLTGGAGNDELWGKAGADTFIFASGWGQDRILDWQNGVDRLDFTALSSFGVHSASDLTIGIESGSTVVRFGGESIMLTGFTGALDSSNWLFA